MKNIQMQQPNSPVDSPTSVDSLPRLGSFPHAARSRAAGNSAGSANAVSRFPRLVAVPEPDVDGHATADAPAGGAARGRFTDASSREATPKILDRLLVRKARRMVILRTRDIQWIEASGNYVKIVTAEGSHLLRSTISDLADQLDPERFLRVHRSAVINTEVLESVETNPAGDYFLRLPGDHRIKCSRTYRNDLRSFLASLQA